MKKLVLLAALVAATLSCGHNKTENTTEATAANDSTIQAVDTDSMVIIDITGEWIADEPMQSSSSTKAPVHSLSLKSDKTAETNCVPTSAKDMKATDKSKAAKKPSHATWKQVHGNGTNNGETLVFFSNEPGKDNTDSVSYQIVNMTDSTLTIQGEAGVFKFKKNKK